MKAMRECFEFVTAIVLAITAFVMGLGMMVAVIATPLIGIGVGIVIAIRIGQWAIGI